MIFTNIKIIALKFIPSSKTNSYIFLSLCSVLETTENLVNYNTSSILKYDRNVTPEENATKRLGTKMG